jgi:hypothetical protein
MNLLVFYSRVQVAGPDECWEWQGSINNSGYGQWQAGYKAFGTPAAHRLAYLFNVGDLVPGMEIDHLCRNRRCVNPSHLEQVEPNVNDFRRRRTHCKRGHEYAVTGDAITYNTDGVTFKSRSCAECNRMHAREHARRMRLAA